MKKFSLGEKVTAELYLEVGNYPVNPHDVPGLEIALLDMKNNEQKIDKMEVKDWAIIINITPQKMDCFYFRISHTPPALKQGVSRYSQITVPAFEAVSKTYYSDYDVTKYVKL